MNIRSKIIGATLAVAFLVPGVALASPGTSVVPSHATVAAAPVVSKASVVQIQQRLRSWGYTTRTDGVIDSQSTRAISHVQRANGLPGHGALDKNTLAIFGMTVAASAPVAAPTTTVATANPPTTTQPPKQRWRSGDCASFRYLFEANGLPWSEFRIIMPRESGCNPNAYNGRKKDRSYGLVQLNTKGALWGELKRRCGLLYKEQLFIPEIHVRCAGIIYRVYGMRPWRTG